MGGDAKPYLSPTLHLGVEVRRRVERRGVRPAKLCEVFEHFLEEDVLFIENHPVSVLAPEHEVAGGFHRFVEIESVQA